MWQDGFCNELIYQVQPPHHPFPPNKHQLCQAASLTIDKFGLGVSWDSDNATKTNSTCIQQRVELSKYSESFSRGLEIVS
jgi:hypothetical protein